MNLLQNFNAFIKKENLFQPQDQILLAVSGGVDSVSLCELCYQAGLQFSIAHCNFQLRGDESERDASFVKSLAVKFKVPLFYTSFETNEYAGQKKISIQVAARELRYDWFYSLINPDTKNPFTHIVTAHHLDDNIETMLMHFFKGTGIAGLRGMLPEQNKIVRPLLFATKTDIEKFAATHQLQWVDDSSNQSDKYTRNYFRHHVIPLVQNQFPQSLNNLSGNLERFREVEILYLQSVHQHKKKLLEYRKNEVHIPVLKLKKTVPLSTIVYEIIKDYSFSPSQVNEVINLLDSETGKYVLSATHRIIKNRNWLILAPVQNEAPAHILVESPEEEIQLTDFRILFSMLPVSAIQTENNKLIGMVDATKIKFPLLVRKWKQGDYFYPLGMKNKKGGRPGKKKIARFLIDLKLSKTEKEKVWVIEMDKKIIWVIGYRIDDRFKITPPTKQVLKMAISQTGNVYTV